MLQPPAYAAVLAKAQAFIPPSWGRSGFPLRLIAASTAILFLLLLLLLDGTRSYLPTFQANHHHNNTSPPPPVTIPNQLHFVYILKDPVAGDFGFQFSHFLSIFAAHHHWRPHKIFLHTNVLANSTAVARARSGEAGKWNRLVLTHFNSTLEINTVPTPTHAGNGRELVNMEHKSDFVRVKAVHDLGGVYIDWDVHALRDIRILLNSGFKAIGGRQVDGLLNSGTFMSTKGGKMIRLWMEKMHVVYDGKWATHSNVVLTNIAERLIREEGEMLIMDREAFAPGGWKNEDYDRLFSLRNETSNLEGLVQGDELPSHEEAFEDRWEHPERFPEWERDWSQTYLLHGFLPYRSGHQVPGFDHITPKYVLSRQSDFARAVYPMAKMLYDQGLMEIEDSYTGT
ncbi:hypothetical protein VTI74DRAFT_8990 [Chaetomium olivicolor]